MTADPTSGRFVYVSLFGGFYGWCLRCERVMFWDLRFSRHIRGAVRAAVRCEECRAGARLLEGDVIRSDRVGYWQEFARL